MKTTDLNIDSLTIAEVRELFWLTTADIPDTAALRRWIAKAAHVAPRRLDKLNDKDLANDLILIVQSVEEALTTLGRHDRP